MVASVISISSDSSEESVGSSTSWVILFGTIPTIIPVDVSTIVPVVPEAASVVASPAGILSSHLEIFSKSDSPDSLSPPDLHETSVARWRIKVALRSSSFETSSPSSPSTPILPSTTITSPASSNRRRFHSSSSSPPRKRHRVSPCLSSSAIHSSSPVSAGPSRKRCSVKVSTEMDVEDTINTRDEGDIVRYTESDIDSDILADIEAYIEAEAPAATEADVAAYVVAVVEGVGDDKEKDDIQSSARGTVDIGVDVVTEPEVPDDIHVPVIAESGSRETFEIGLDVVIQQLYDHMSVGGSNIRLQDALGVEREMTASVEHRFDNMSEELRRIQMAYQYDRADFRRLETFAIRRLGYRP
ncbi:hypothetical protein Tco_1429330 [Tanacetum coccineum]